MESDNPQACSVWERKHATLMNTSPPVMHSYYIRYGMTEQNEISLNAANNDIGLVPNDEIQSKLDNISAVHEASLEARKKKMTKILERRVDSTTHVQSYLVQYDDGVEEWVPTTRLHGARQIVTEFMERSSPLKSLPSIRLQESIRAAIPSIPSKETQSAPICSTNQSPSIVISSTSTELETILSNTPIQGNLVPTFSLSRPTPAPVPIPSLVSTSSSPCSSPPHDEDTRELAESIATQFIHPQNQQRSNLFGRLYQRRDNDWFCDYCGYDNFSYRNSCKNCNKSKVGKRSAGPLNNPRPTKKAKTDIIAILGKGKNKENEVIYQVKSLTQGITWVREKHVPADLL
jgi:hypothetical protein